MPSNNPNVAGKHYRQAMSALYGKLERMAAEQQQYLDTVEQHHIDYYTVVLRELQESTSPDDEELFDKIDRVYARQMASVQAARERLIEASAHIKNALLPDGHTAHLKNVTPETFS